jgi:hypothetical protein
MKHTADETIDSDRRHNGMSQITRQSFINTMSSGAASGVDPNGLTPATQQALETAGITAGSLDDIAGADARISGEEELKRLFELIDRVDRNGSTRSIATTARGDDGRLVATPSGAAAQALMDEIEKARVNRGTSAPIAPFADTKHERAIERLEAAGLTNIHLAKGTPYYNQADKQWRDYSYPKSPPVPGTTRTLRDAGCAPCALAMADVTLRGSGTKPTNVADFAVDGGFSGKPKEFGTDTVDLARAWANANNLAFTLANSPDNSKDVDAIRAGLEAGGVALIGVGIDDSGGRGHFTASGHVMLVNGYATGADGTEWFFVANPGRRNQEDSPTLKTDATVKQDLSLNPAVGAVRITRAQLEAELSYACILERSL